MRSIQRARIVPCASDDSGVTTARHGHPPWGLGEDRHRRIARETLEAREAARELLTRARADADAIVAEAKRGAKAVAERAADEAREAEQAKVAAMYLRLRHEDERRAARDLDRAIDLAVVLAERILGASLVRDPELIVPMAQQALTEARGARRIAIDASPLDAAVLRRHFEEAGFERVTLEVRSDPSQERGSLRIATNLGTLDAQLRPQIERLAKALRDTLPRG